MTPVEVRFGVPLTKAVRNSGASSGLRIAIENGRMLRLNDMRASIVLSGERLVAGADPFAAVYGLLERACDAFDRGAQAFLAGHRAWVEGELAKRPGQAISALAGYDGLFRLDDWKYSAPMPLPRAELLLGSAQVSCIVDFAFWTGASWSVVLLKGRIPFPSRARERLHALETAGVAFVEIDTDAGLPDVAAVLARLLPANAIEFWTGQALPMGPFRTAKEGFKAAGFSQP